MDSYLALLPFSPSDEQHTISPYTEHRRNHLKLPVSSHNTSLKARQQPTASAAFPPFLNISPPNPLHTEFSLATPPTFPPPPFPSRPNNTGEVLAAGTYTNTHRANRPRTLRKPAMIQYRCRCRCCPSTNSGESETGPGSCSWGCGDGDGDGDSDFKTVRLFCMDRI